MSTLEERREANKKRRSAEIHMFLKAMQSFKGGVIDDFHWAENENDGPAVLVKLKDGRVIRFGFNRTNCIGNGGECEATATVNGVSISFEPEQVR